MLCEVVSISNEYVNKICRSIELCALTIQLNFTSAIYYGTEYLHQPFRTVENIHQTYMHIETAHSSNTCTKYSSCKDVALSLLLFDCSCFFCVFFLFGFFFVFGWGQTKKKIGEGYINAATNVFVQPLVQHVQCLPLHC